MSVNMNSGALRSSILIVSQPGGRDGYASLLPRDIAY